MQDALNDQSLPVRGARILVVGVAYKRNIDDIASPLLSTSSSSWRRRGQVAYHDPYVPSLQLVKHSYRSQPLEDLGRYSAVAILTDHSNIDYAQIAREAQLIVDTRNATREVRELATSRGVRIVRL